jgi:hypothetical protein
MGKLTYIVNPKVHWGRLSGNPNAIHLLEQNLDKVNWHLLSWNPNAIHLLEQNLDKVHWSYLSSKPNLLLINNNFFCNIANDFINISMTFFFC